MGYMALLSLMFDFGSCLYPSSKLPFFTSGRLMLCVMQPILFCMTWSIDRITAYTGRFRGIHFLILFCLAMTVTEIYLVLEPLQSACNFFHIPLGALN